MKSMILSGAARSGKTTLARRLQKETGFSLISGDALLCRFQDFFPQLNITLEGDYEAACRNWEDFIVAYLDHMITWQDIPFILDTVNLLPEQVKRRGLDRKYVVAFFGIRMPIRHRN
jgi:broad-specificity NMP kinase